MTQLGVSIQIPGSATNALLPPALQVRDLISLPQVPVQGFEPSQHLIALARDTVHEGYSMRTTFPGS